MARRRTAPQSISVCFCAIEETGQGPPFWTYSGYVCDNGTAHASFQSYASPQATTATWANPCSCGDGNCPDGIPQALAAVQAASTSGMEPMYCTVCEKGVPNPTNPGQSPDEPILRSLVLGEYKAETALGKNRERLRLIQFQVPSLFRVFGAAYLIKPDSPCSPHSIPLFTEKWLKVTEAADGRHRIEVLGLGTFELQVLR